MGGSVYQTVFRVRLTLTLFKKKKGTDITFLKIVYYLNKYLHQQLRINQMFSYTRHRSKSDISNRKGRSREMTLVGSLNDDHRC